jgi:hypothetical protein
VKIPNLIQTARFHCCRLKLRIEWRAFAQIDYFSIESDWKLTPGNSDLLAEKRLMSLAFQIEFIVLEIPFFAFTDVTKCNWCNTIKSTAQ